MGSNKQKSSGHQSVAPEQRESLHSIFQKPQLLIDENLTSSDWMRIQTFYTLWPGRRCGPLQFRSRLSSHVFVPLYNASLSHSSALFRSAILVLMSKLKEKGSDQDTLGYFNVFYRRARESIDANAISEIVYASYIIAVHGLIAEESIQEALVYCLQFCRALKSLIRSGTVGEDELSWIETLWQGVLSSIFYISRHLQFNNVDDGEQMERFWGQLQQILDESSCLLPSDSDIAELPLSMCTETICQKVISLSIYMQFYLDRFLFRASCHSSRIVENVEPVRAWLHKILGQIIPLINQLSNISDYIYHAYSIRIEVPDSNHESAPGNLLHFTNLQPRGLKPAASPTYRDSALALLYAFARLLKTLLEQMNEYPETGTSKIDQSAIALYRVCGSFPRHTFTDVMAPLLIKRSLFWAGIILRKSQFPAGSPFYIYFSWYSSRTDHRQAASVHSPGPPVALLQGYSW